MRYKNKAFLAQCSGETVTGSLKLLVPRLCPPLKPRGSRVGELTTYGSVESESSYSSFEALKAFRSVIGGTSLNLSGQRENTISVYWVRRYH